MQKKQSVTEYLAGLDKGSIYLYLVVCVGCAAAMLINMGMQRVSLSALWDGTPEEQKLLLLTAMVVTICVAGAIMLVSGLRRKNERELYKKSTGNRKRR